MLWDTITFTNHGKWYKVKLLMSVEVMDFSEEKYIELYKKATKIALLDIQF